MQKRIISMVLVLCMTIGLLPTSVIADPNPNSVSLTATSQNVTESSAEIAVSSIEGATVYYAASGTPLTTGSAIEVTAGDQKIEITESSVNTISLTGLAEKTEYTYYLVAKSEDNYSDVVSVKFTTSSTPKTSFTVTTTAKTTTSGEAITVDLTGAGNYDPNSSVTVAAPIAAGYNFDGWYKAEANALGYTGEKLSTGAELAYTFEVTEDIDLVAVYKQSDVTSVTLSDVDLALDKLEEKLLIATVWPVDGVSQEVIWSSSDTSKATVTQAGLVKAIAEGPATITATTVDGHYSATCEITVKTSVYNYQLDYAGTGINITGYTGETGVDLIIPDTIGGKPVTLIGYEAFQSKELTHVTIPSTVIVIDSSAFQSNKLTSLDLPLGILQISRDAFANNNLSHVTIPSLATYIGDTPFRGNKALFIEVSEDNPKFSSCKNGGLYTKDGKELLSGTQLVANNLPKDLTVIRTKAFSGNNLTHVTIPLNVTTIGSQAFQSNALTNVTIPAAVTSIGSQAFSYNSKLTYVIVPGSVTGIEYQAFGENQNLIVYGERGSAAETYSTGKHKFELLNKITSVTLEETLTVEQGERPKLIATISPADVTNKDLRWESDHPEIVAVDATGLATAIAVGQATITVTTEEGGHTDTCVVTVTEPTNPGEKVMGISLEPVELTLMAKDSKSLEAAVLPATAIDQVISWSSNNEAVATVSETGLVTAVKEGQAIITATTHERGHTATCVVTVEKLNYNYKLITNDTEVQITGYTGTTGVDLIIPDTIQGKPVTSIGNNAFQYKELTHVTIPESVKTIGSNAFSSNGLTRVVIPSSVTSIGTYAFYSNALTDIVISLGVKSIGSYAFRNNNLTHVVIPSSVTSMSYYMFDGNPNLISIEIPPSVSSIQNAVLGDNPTGITIYGQPDSKAEGVAKAKSLNFSPLVSLDKTTFHMKKGTTESLQATVFPEDREIVWSSSDPAIARVDSNGLVTAEGLGTATITVTTADGTYTAKSVVTVGNIKVSVKTTALGAPVELIGAGDYTDGTSVTVKAPIAPGYNFHGWYRAAEGEPGYTGEALGEPLPNETIAYAYTFEIVDQNIDLLAVYSASEVTGVSLELAKITLEEKQTQTLVATVLPIEASNKDIVWSSSSSAYYATVDQTGLVTANKEGSTTITATTVDGKHVATCELTIKKGLYSYDLMNYDTEVKITAYNGTDKEIDIPETLVGQPVTSIANYAFSNKSLTRVTIPLGVKTIGHQAFYKNALTHIEIPSSVTTIDTQAFTENTSLASITIPPSVIDIGGYYKNLITPTTTTIYGQPGSEVATYAGAQFQPVVSLDKLALTLKEGTAETLVATVWAEDASNTGVTWSSSNRAVATVDTEGKVTAITQGQAIITATRKGGAYTATSTVTVSEPYEYSFIKGELEVEITKYTGLGGDLMIPAELGGKPVTSIGASAFENKKLKSIIIQEGITNIGVGAFKANQLTSLIIPKSVTTIGLNAFAGNGLTPSDFTLYGEVGSAAEVHASQAGHTFIGQTKVVSVELNTKTLEFELGKNEEAILTATISPVGAIQKAITWKSNNPAIATVSKEGLVVARGVGEAIITVTTVDGSLEDTCKVTVGAGLYTYQLDASGTGIEITKYTGPENVVVKMPAKIAGKPVTRIGNKAFYSQQITRVIIPFGVTSIGSEAFAYAHLKDVTIPSSVTSIGGSAFYYCDLTDVIIPVGLTSIESSVFEGNKLVHVKIPASVISIGTYAFRYNASLESVLIPKSVMTLRTDVFGSKPELIIYGERNSAAETYTTGKHVFSPLDKVVSVTLDIETLALEIGERQQLIETINPADATNTAVIWASDKPEIVAVDQDGLLTAIAEGEATITVTTEEGGHQATCVVTVSQPAIPGQRVTRVDLDEAELTLKEKTTKILKATVLPETALDQQVLWSSSNEAVATVDQQGLVRGSAPGEVIITATTQDNGHTATCEVTVTNLNLGYKLINENTEIEITEYTGPSGVDVIIPDKIDGKPVTSIGDNAFGHWDYKITGITIPASVTNIGSQAFKENSLQSVELPSGIISIGTQAFYDNKLTHVTIPSGITTVPGYAFSKNKLASVTLPSSLTAIGDYAFAENLLEVIEIPSSVVSIGISAFKKNLLKGLVIPSSVTSIGSSAFFDNHLTSVEIPSSISKIESSTFETNNLASIEIPSSVTEIGYYAFKNNVLTSIKLPSSVTTIKYQAFFENDLLSHVTIPLTLKTIESSAFPATTTIYGQAGSVAQTYGKDQFKPVPKLSETSLTIKEGTTGNLIVTVPAESGITEGVTWSNSNDLVATLDPDQAGLIRAITEGTTTITITTIDGGYVGKCVVTVNEPYQYELIKGDTEVEITSYTGRGGAIIIPATLGGKTVTSIRAEAFKNKALTSVSMPKGITSIGVEAFSTNQLTQVVIPEGVTDISNSMFANNEGLISVTLPEGITRIGEAAFLNNAITGINIPETVTRIEAKAFENNRLKTISIPERVTYIGADAFKKSLLESVIIPASVITMGDNIFAVNAKTQKEFIIYGESVEAETYATTFNHTYVKKIAVTSIGLNESNLAFELGKYDQATLIPTITPVDAPNRNITWTSDNLAVAEVNQSGLVTAIGAGEATITATTEEGKYQATCEVTVVQGLYNYSLDASKTGVVITGYNGSTGVELIIPDKIAGKPVTSIGYNAFWAKRLTHITIPSSVTTIGSDAFSSNNLTDIKIPSGVTTIGSYAFSNNQLTEVTIPSGVTAIERSVFSNNKLTHIIIPSSVISIASSAFSENDLTDVIIPSSVTSIGSSAFNNNKLLTSLIVPGSVTTIGTNAFGVKEDLIIYGEIGSEAQTYSEGKHVFIELQKMISVALPETLEVEMGERPTLIATINPEGATNPKITWKSNKPEIVAIDQTGLATAIAEGTAIITVTTDDGGHTATCTVTVTEPTTPGLKVMGVKLNKIDFSLIQADTEILTATVLPETAENQKVTWLSSNEAVARVDEKGAVTGIAPGEATITVTTQERGYTASCRVTVKQLDYTYKLIENDTEIKIERYNGAYSVNVTIPNKIAGKPVTSIGQSAFNSKNLTGVTIPSTVTFIGDSAFVVNQLTQVEIPSGVTSIGSSAFERNLLTSIEIPSGVTSIGSSAFKSNLITSVEIPSGVTSISSDAFRNNALTHVFIPTSVTSIYGGAFLENPDLTTVTISPKVSSMGKTAFPDTTTIYGQTGSTTQTSGGDRFKPVASLNKKELVLKEGLKETLIRAVAPESLISQEVTWSSSNELVATVNQEGLVTAISQGETSIKILTKDGLYSAACAVTVTEPYEYKLINDDKEVEITNYTGLSLDLVIPAQLEGKPVTGLGASAFKNKGLTRISIPQTVTYIAEEAFHSNKLTNVEIPTDVITMGANVFGNNVASSYDLIIRGESPVAEAYAADYKHTFGQKIPVLSLKLSETTIKLQLEANKEARLIPTFNPLKATNQMIVWTSNDAAIAVVNQQGLVTATGAGRAIITATTVDGGHIATCTVDVSKWDFDYKLDARETGIIITKYNNDTATKVVIPNTIAGKPVTSIGSQAFYSKSNLTSVTIPSSVTTIEYNAFRYSGLTSVDIPAGVTTIGGQAFANNKLTSVRIPSGVTTIEYGTFENNKLTHVEISSGLTNIRSSAFKGNALTNVAIPSSVTSISEEAFNANPELFITVDGNNPKYWNCDKGGLYTKDRKTILSGTQQVAENLPTDVTTIGGYAFSGNQLTSVIIPSSVTEIKSSAYSSNKLTRVIIPSSVTTIKDRVFLSNKLSSVIIPSSVTTIGDYAFDGGAAFIIYGEEGSAAQRYSGTHTFKILKNMEAIALDLASVEVEIDERSQLTAITAPVDASNQRITWASSDPETVAVNQEGLLTALAIGEATITVTTEEGGYTATCAVTVKESTKNPGEHVTKVSLDKTNLILKTKTTSILKATVSPDTALNQEVTWSSSNANVAKVDQNGLVTAIAAGETIITVTTSDRGHTASCQVQVGNIDYSYDLLENNTMVRILRYNGSDTRVTIPGMIDGKSVKYIDGDYYGNFFPNKNLTYVIIPASVTVVSGNSIFSNQPKDFIIYGQVGSAAETYANAKQLNFSSIVSLDKKEIYLAKEGVESLKATILPEDREDKQVIWSSSDPSIAKVDNNGRVTGMGLGTTTITVITADGGYTTTCKVNVGEAKRLVSTQAIGPSVTLTGAGEYIKGASVTLTAPLAINYNFDGWYKAAEGELGYTGEVLSKNHTYTFELADQDLDLVALYKLSEIASINLDPAEITLEEQASQLLVATILPTTASNQNVTWSSSNEQVATVSKIGLVTGKKGGTATITATTVDGNHIGTSAITVIKGLYDYTVLSNNTIEIIAYNGTDKDLTIPEMIAGKLVTKIGNSVFEARGLTRVTIPAGITVIGEKAFNNNTLTSVRIPAGITTMYSSSFPPNTTIYGQASSAAETAGGYYRFKSIIDLKQTELSLKEGTKGDLTASILLESGISEAVLWSTSNDQVATVDGNGLVTAIGKGKAVITITTVDGGYTAKADVTVTEPYDYVFIKGNTEVEITNYTGLGGEIIIHPELGGKPVTSIGANAFKGKNLKSAIIPESVTSIGNEAFSNNNLTSIIIPEGVVTMGDNLFTFNVGTSYDFIINGQVGSAAEAYAIKFKHAFGQKTPVESVELNLATLELALKVTEKASLTATISPVNATNKKLVWTSDNLAVATVDQEGIVTAIGAGTANITSTTVDGDYAATCKVTVLKWIYDYKLDASGTGFEITRYSGTDKILVIPATIDEKPVTSIGVEAFSGKSLTHVTIPASVTSIGNWAFQTNNLTSVVIPSSVTAIGQYAFNNINSLSSVMVPGNVTTIGTNAFGTNKELIIAGETGSEAQNYSLKKHRFVLFNGQKLAVINKENVELGIGHEIKVTAKAIPESVEIQQTTWSSDHTDIATIDKNGTIKAVAEGIAIITVTITTAEGDVTGTCTVKVTSQVPRLNAGIYEIENAYHLNWFSSLVNGTLESGIKNKLAKGKLMNDIVAGDDFVPIGLDNPDSYWAEGYNGNFDGGGHTVTLNINQPDKKAQGLFGIVSGGVVIKNVGVDGTVIGGAFTAGIVGMSMTTGTVTISNCWNNASITSTSHNAAGIFACSSQKNANITIENCYNTGTITGVKESAAISGWLGSQAKINNCYNTGTVYGNDVGKSFARFATGSTVNFTNCYGLDTVGIQADINAKTTEQFKSGEVTYLLNSSKSDGTLVWGQRIGTDSSPIFYNENRVYKNRAVNGGFNYSNSPEATVSVTFKSGANGSLTGTTIYPDIVAGTGWQAAVTKMPETLANSGYQFSGWTPALPTIVTEDMTYTANFTESANIIITYVAGVGGTLDKTSEAVLPITGTIVGATATASANYTFVNWTNSAGEEVSTVVTFVPAKVAGLNKAETYTANFIQNQAAPIGLVGIAPRSTANNDGQITNVTDAMEYRLKGSADWIAVTKGKTALTGLVAGTYQVRLAVKPGFKVGAIVEVTLAAYVKSTDASISGVKVTDKDATVSGLDSKTYNIELVAGTDLSTLIATDIVVALTDSKATLVGAITLDSGATWTVDVTAEDGITKVTYTIKVTSKSIDATLSNLTIDGKTVPGFAANKAVYDVELAAGIDIVPTVLATVVATGKASVMVTPAAKLAGSTTVMVTAEDRKTTKTYTINFTVAGNANQAAPTRLKAVAVTVAGKDGKITGTTTAMEYRLKNTGEWLAAPEVVVTGLAAGTYEVRLAAKKGLNSGAIVEVIIADYVKSTDASISSVKVKGQFATVNGADPKAYSIELAPGTDLSKLVATDILVTTKNSKATMGAATTKDQGATWTVVVTAEDGLVNVTYTINVTSKSMDASLSDLTVDGIRVANFAANKTVYDVALVAGTDLVPTVVGAVTVTEKASATVTPASSLPGNTTVLVTAEDGKTTRTYTIRFTVTGNADQAAPKGLSTTAVTAKGNDGQITNVTTEMEYRFKDAKAWTPVTGTPVTGLAAGTYEVRFAAKKGFNAGIAVEVTVADYIAPKSTDATLSDLRIDGAKVTGFAANQFTYNVELPAGTEVVPLVLATVTATGKANVVVTPAAKLAGNTTVLVTAEDGATTKTYTINFTVAGNANQAAPTGLKAVKVTVGGNNGKITGTTTAMEYRMKNAGEWLLVKGTEVTGLAAGTYEVRFTAKKGFNAGAITEVVIDDYVAPKSTDATLSDLIIGGITVADFAADKLDYNLALAAGTNLVPVVVAKVAATGKANAVVTAGSSLPGSTKIVVTAEDGTTTKTYTINFTVAGNADQVAPKGIATTAVTAKGNDGQITNITTVMEYRLKDAKAWTPVTGTPVTGLAAGTYEVRFAAKTGFNAGTAVEVTVADYIAPKSTDATLSDLRIDGAKVTGFAANQFTYNVELPAGTEVVPTVLATVTATGKANVVVTPAAKLAGSTTVVVTAEDGTTTKTYTINFTVAGNTNQAVPTGLKAVKVTVGGNNGKITGTTTAMEYRMKNAGEWLLVKGTEVTGLAAGTYEVRFTAKKGYNAGAITEVIIDDYVAPKSTDATLSDLIIGGITVADFAADKLDYNLALAAGTNLVPVVVAKVAATGKANAVVTAGSSLPGSTKIVVTAEDGTTTKTYTINFTVAGNADQVAPKGIATTAVTAKGNDGQITNITTVMEYRLKDAKAWTPVTGTPVTGLAAGTYEVRFAAKTGFNAGTAVEVTVADYIAPKSTDATLSDLRIDGAKVTGFAANQFTYNVELPAGTEVVPTVLATVTATGKANVVVTPAAKLAGSTTVVVTAEDGATTKTYTINFTVAGNANQAAPTGLKVVNVTVGGNNGKITGTTTAMEYRMKNAGEWLLVKGTEVTGLAAGTYEVRFAAKKGFNAGTAVEVTVADYIAPKSTDATLSDLRIDGAKVTGFAANQFTYNVELPAGTEVVPTVLATVTATGKANVVVTPAVKLAGSTTVVVTAEDGATTKTYTINFTVAGNANQAVPTGLKAVKVTVGGNNGKITGTTTAMEYRMKNAGEWLLVKGTEVTGLAAGTYEVRFVAKTGFNAGAITEVVIEDYVAPKSTDATLSDLIIGGITVADFAVDKLDYNLALAAGTNLVPAVVAKVAATGKANAVVTAASSLPGSTKVVVTAEDGTTTKTYTINFTVAGNADQVAPKGIATTAVTAQGNDGQITNVTTEMEYRFKDAKEWTPVTGAIVTGLAAGTYEVRFAAKIGFNAGKVVETTVKPEQKPEQKPEPSQGGGGGGGNALSKDDSNITVTTLATKSDKSNPVTQATVTVIPTVAKDTASVTLSQNAVESAIKKAQEEVLKNGTEKHGIKVEIKIDSKTDNTSIAVSNISIDLPKATVEALTMAGVKELIISSDIGVFGLDLETLKTIQNEIKGDVKVSANKVDNTTLSEAAKVVVGDRPVYDFTIAGSSGEKVTQFGKGKISITLPYTLREGEKSENVVAYYIDDEGKVREMPNSVYDQVTGMISFETDHFSKFAIGYKEDEIPVDVETDTSSKVFTDIATHWAKKDIEFVTARGLFGGTAEGIFSPNMSMTRGMLVTVLSRLAKADLSSYTTSNFADVKSDAYYMSAIEWAKEKGIVNGISATEFAPNQAITREQLAAIMVNYSKASDFALPELKVEVSFTDNEKISRYAKASVKQMQMAGLLSGRKDNAFDARATATRAEVSAVLKRLIELIEQK